MKTISRILILVLLILQLNGGFINEGFAVEDKTIEVNNGFVKYSVNKDNGRFSISTKTGAAYRNDENQPLLFEEYVPDTSFTTFRIDNKDYIFGNDYGLLGSSSELKKSPNNIGLKNESVWVINGIEITQTLILDNSNKNAGNVKISYKVKNKTNKDIKIGSRILLDTMLGANDGSPVIMPGNQTFIEKETRLEGEQIPVYWKSVDNKIFSNVISYGLISGWRNENITKLKDEFYNTKPNEMIIGHWEGLSKTKWDYDIDTMLDFTSCDNTYGSRDSAIALYWDEQTLKAGSERIYETYYGLGEFSTLESEVPVNFNVYSPERLYLNEKRTGYTDKTVIIGGEIDNTLNGSQKLINAKVTIDFNTTGLTLPYGESKTIDIGTIDVNQIVPFSWELNNSTLYSWTQFMYRVTLTADNLSQSITRDGDVLIPSISGQPPEIKFTEFLPNNLYNLDNEKVLTLNGENLDAITSSNDYRVILKSIKDNSEYIIEKENLKFSTKSIIVNIPKSLGLTKIDSYKVRVQYSEDGKSQKYIYKTNLNISDNKKYMTRKYGVLLVVREKDLLTNKYKYNLVNAKDEKELKHINEFYKNNNKSDDKGYIYDIMLDIRADKIISSGDVYTIESETATINSVITSHCNSNYGDDKMTIEKKKADVSHKEDYINITGSCGLWLPGFKFRHGPYEMKFIDGDYYSVTGENGAKDVVIEKPLFYEGAFNDDFLMVIQALPIHLNNAILREDSITFGGKIDLSSLLNGVNTIYKKKNEDKDENKNKDKGKKEDEKDDVDLGLSLNVDDLRFGVSNSKVELKGLKADGKIGIPREISEKIIPGMDLGAEIEVSIDTFDNWKFSMKSEINFELIQAKSNVVYKIYNLYGFPLPIPDTVIMYGENKHPGIPLIPPVPIAYLTGLGGGFENLYDTITGNFVILPPLTLNAIASFQLFKIFEADEVELKVSARGISINVSKINIGTLKIFENAGMHMLVTDEIPPNFEIKTYAGLNIEDWLKGEAYIVCKLDNEKNGILGPFALAGIANASGQIPDDFPIGGGTELGNVSCGISDEGVFGKIRLFKILPASFAYYWGGRATLGIASTEDISKKGIYSVVNYDDQGNPIGTVCIGENFHVVSDSRSKYMFAAITNNPGFYLADLNMKEHLLDINNHEYSLIEVEYNGSEPTLHLFDQNGDEVILEEDKNYFVQEVKGTSVNKGNKISIPIKNPGNGQWKLTSSENVNVKLIKVDELPELTNVDSQINGKQLIINWSGNKLTDEKINVILCTDKETDPGKIIVNDIDVSSGTTTIQLPNDLPSGDYFLRVQLLRKDGVVLDTCEPDYTVQYIDEFQPLCIKDMAVSNIGNGLLNVTWNDQEIVDGYIIDVVDQETKERVSSFELTENAGDNIIGGTYNQITSLSRNNSAKDTVESGMIPGRIYEIDIYTYNNVNGIKHYSEKATKTVTINEPNPTNINYELSCELGQIIDKGINENIETYLTNNKDIKLLLSSDQQTLWKVIVNDKIICNQTIGDTVLDIHLTSEYNNIGIEAVNNQGDISEKGFTIKLDQEAPVLRIDSPKQGELVNDNIEISGFVDLNSTLIVNGTEVNYNNDGLFNIEIPMHNKMVKIIHVEAIDEAGNKSEYLAELYNDSINDIKEIKIQPNINKLGIGDKVDYNVYLIDKDNNKFLVEDSAINWLTLNDYGVIDVNQEGMVDALAKGKDILIASYQISEEYAFEDATIIEVVEDLAGTKDILVNPDYIKIKKNEQHVLNVYEIFNDLSNRLLDNQLLEFNIISGKELIDINDDGKVIAKKIGKAIVSVKYEKNGIAYEANVIIDVCKTNGYYIGLTQDDNFIINIIKGFNEYVSIIIEVKQSSIKKEAGKIKLSISSEDIERAVYKARNNKISKKQIIFKIPQINGISGCIIDIPTSILKSDNENIIGIETELGSVMLPCNMMKEEFREADNISLIFEKAQKEVLHNDIKEKIGNRPIIEINIKKDRNIINWENKISPVRISLPYTIKDNEDYEKIVVLYIDKEGNATKVTNGKFDSKRSMVVFDTSHFSIYAVAYDEKTFEDLDKHLWAKRQIEVLASKGIINGTSDTAYSPKNNITRADFVTLLVRTLGLEAEVDSNFSDITITDYYYEEVGIAKKLGITTDVGNNIFNPRESITRQDMMILTERALRVKGKLIEDIDTTVLNRYEDVGEIASYAKDSVALLVNEGLIKGSGNKINPMGNSTRAEIAVLLYRIYNEE